MFIAISFFLYFQGVLSFPEADSLRFRTRLLFFLIGWGLMIPWAANLLWAFRGRQRVALGANTLSVRSELLGLGWNRVYPTEGLGGFSAFPVSGTTSKLRPLKTQWAVAFSQGGHRHTFGGGLNEEDALAIAERLRERHLSV